MSEQPRPPAPATSAGGSPPVVDGARAQLLAWLALALVNVVFAFALVRPGRGSLTPWLLGMAFGVGQFACAGLVSAAAVRLAAATAPRRRGAALVALYAVAGPLGVLAMREDFANLAGSSTWKMVLFAAAAATSIPAAAWVAARLSRGWLRLLLACAGLAAGVANDLVLPRNYLGLHLYAAWGAALLLAGSFAGSPLPRGLVEAVRRGSALAVQVSLGVLGPRATLPGGSRTTLLARRRRSGALAAQALLWALGLLSVVAVPGSGALAELYRVPGAGLAPFIARLHYAGAGASAYDGGSWYRDRSHQPPRPATQPPLLGPRGVVLLLTVDALRADVLAPARAEELPVLHRLAREGVTFSEARSPSCATVPSLAGLFTGRFFSQLYWSEQTGGGRQKLFPHEDDSPRLPVLVAATGAKTALVVSGTGFDDRYGLTNGFEERIGRGVAVGRPAASLTRDIIARLRKVGPDDGLFLYTHYFEPHAPYDRGGKEGSPFERYLREVAIVDADLGQIVESIGRLGLSDRTLLIVSGDHGEAFGEHGTRDHAVSLYEELVHVPLVVWGGSLQPRVVDDDVSLADLGPTILDAFGSETPANFMGESLVGFLRGQRPDLARPVVVESGRHVRGMYFPDHLKLLVDSKLGTRELFDLANDPDELHNLYEERGDDAKAREAQLQAYFEAHALVRPGYTMPYRP